MCVIWNTDVVCALKYSKLYFQCKHGGCAIAPLQLSYPGEHNIVPLMWVEMDLIQANIELF